MRLALPQAGLVLFQASPDAPDEDLNPALGPELIVSLIFFLQSVSGFFKRKLFTVAAAERRAPAVREHEKFESRRAGALRSATTDAFRF